MEEYEWGREYDDPREPDAAPEPARDSERDATPAAEPAHDPGASAAFVVPVTANPTLAAIGRAVAVLTARGRGDETACPATAESSANDGASGCAIASVDADSATSPGAGPGLWSEADVLVAVQLASQLTRLASGVDVTGGPSSVLRELPVAVEDLRRSVDALAARATLAAQADGTWALEGQGTFTAWMIAKTQATRSKVTRETARAQRLRDYLPTFTALLLDGRISAEHVDALVKHGMNSAPRIQALSDTEVGEKWLAGLAAAFPVSQFTTLVRGWAARVDPDAQERQWRERLATEYLTLAPTMGGWHLDGVFNDEHGQMLRIALNAQTGQVSSKDERSRGQRDANALTELVKMTLDSGQVQGSARIRPHLIAIVPVETLTRTTTASRLAGRVAEQAALINLKAEGIDEQPEAVLTAALDLEQLRGTIPATWENGQPLAPGQLGLHLCDSAISRVITDAHSEVIDVGRESRLFTRSQAIGIIARDRHCQYPGCNALPNWCQLHHIIWWTRDGQTNISDGILLCWTHHTQVHALGLSILRFPDRWEYRRPNGTHHGTTPRHHHYGHQPTLPINTPRRR